MDKQKLLLSLYGKAVECFEKYEKIINNNKINGNLLVLRKHQQACCDSINKLIQLENSNLYFTTLYNIRTQLNQHLSVIKDVEQVTINDVTITKVSSDSSLSSIDSDNDQMNWAINENNRTEIKKRKLNDDNSIKNDKLEEVIENTLVITKGNGLQDIGGLEEEKQSLKEAVLLPLKYPHLFKGARKPWNKILLYGPPGTGKTQLVRSLAHEANAQLYSVSSADLLSRWVGESEKLIRMLFQICKKNKNKLTFIFIDEVDGLCRTRLSTEADHTRRMKNELLTQLSNMDTASHQTFFIAATNCPWDIDPAFIRRFQKRIFISLPNREARLKILKIHLKELQAIEETKWNNILDHTDGFSGSDLADLVNAVAYEPLKDLDNPKFWIITEDNKYMATSKYNEHTITMNLKAIPSDRIIVRNIDENDFHTALQTVTKTVDPNDITKFEKFNRNFGSLRKN